MAFKSTAGTGVIWNPTKTEDGDPRTEATDKDILDGYYVGKKENVGEHDSNVYTIKKDNGDEVQVWGTKTLNEGMGEVRLGSYVRIQWHGKLLTKKGAEKKPNQRLTTDSFHKYEVFIDEDKAPMKTNADAARSELSKPTGGFEEKSKRNVPVPDDSDDLPFFKPKYDSIF